MTAQPSLPPMGPPPGAVGGSADQPPKPPPWTAEEWDRFIETVKPIGKYLGDLWKWKAQLDAEQQEKWDKRSLFTIGVLMGFLGSIILLMSWLTYEGKVSGDALLFVVGAVTSWILFAVQRYLFEPAPSEQEQKPFL